MAKKINIFFYNGILGGAILSPPKLKGLKQSLAGLMWPVGCTLAMSGLVVKAGNSWSRGHGFEPLHCLLDKMYVKTEIKENIGSLNGAHQIKHEKKNQGE